MKGKIADLKNGKRNFVYTFRRKQRQVDNWAKEVEKAGGKIISKPEEFGKGYYGFVFADPDGHKFNVFYM